MGAQKQTAHRETVMSEKSKGGVPHYAADSATSQNLLKGLARQPEATADIIKALAERPSRHYTDD